MRKIKGEPRRLLHGNDFMFGLYQYISDRKVGADILTEKRFTIKDTDTTYRVINHWSNLGLFDDSREEGERRWRKFSITDITWLAILRELREFGLSLGKIKVGYESIKNVNELLEFGIGLCMLHKSVYLIVYADGFIDVATKGVITLSELTGVLNESSYLVLSLNSCLGKTFSGDFKPHLHIKERPELSEKEISVLSAIRSGCDEIIVHMKNGQIDRIDTTTKHIGDIGKLSNILNTVSNGEFVIKKQGGKIIFLEKTKKEKV